MYVFRKLFNNGPQHVTERFFIDHKPNLIFKKYIFSKTKKFYKNVKFITIPPSLHADTQSECNAQNHINMRQLFQE